MSGLETQIAALAAEQDRLSQAIAQRRAQGQAFDELREQARALSQQIKALKAQAAPPTADASEPSAPARQARAEVLTTAQQVLALQPEWGELLAHSSAASPFMTWEWMSAWYEVYGAAGQSRCLAIRDAADRLIGLAPLFLSTHRDPVLPPGHLGWASSYGPSWGIYLEPISADGEQLRVAEALVEHLDATSSEWRCVKLVRVPAESRILGELIQAAAARRWRLAIKPSLVAVTADLPADPQDFGEQLPSRKRGKNNRQAARRLQRDHPDHRFRCCRDAEELEHCLERLAELNITRRANLEAKSNFVDERFRACFATALRRFWEGGWLRVAILEVGKEIAALWTYLVYRERLYVLQPAFDVRYAAYEPSHLLLVFAVQEAIAAGARSLDFLTGAHSYKLQYAAGRRQIVDITIWDNRLRGAWEVSRETIWAAARSTAKRLLKRAERT